ncbi:hypothetical protein LCGC14_1210580, partial [marine sediment metagenome]
SGGESRQEEIQAEVKAALITAGVKARRTGWSRQGSSGGQGPKLSSFEEIEQAYTEGKVTREVYKKAMEAR